MGTFLFATGFLTGAFIRYIIAGFIEYINFQKEV